MEDLKANSCKLKIEKGGNGVCKGFA